MLETDLNLILYDCDFNQMLGLKVGSSEKHISEFNEENLTNRNIMISQHYLLDKKMQKVVEEKISRTEKRIAEKYYERFE